MLWDNIIYDYSNTFCYIYYIQFNNNKGYIGSTNNPRVRINRHIREIRNNQHKNPIFTNCYKKHGIKSINILAKFAKEYRKSMEEWFINISSLNTQCNIKSNVDAPILIYREGQKKFNKNDIIDIFKLALTGKTNYLIAEKYNVDFKLISLILNGKIYRYESKDYLHLYLAKQKHLFNEKRKQAVQKITKSVYCFTIDGKFLKKFTSARDASVFANCNSSAIKSSIHRKGSCSGYYFTYNKDFDMQKPKLTYRPEKIYKLNSNFNLMVTFETTKECAKIENLPYRNLLNKVFYYNKSQQVYYVKEKNMVEFKQVYNL